MGDISVFGRRLKDGHVQYGWCGNGGYFSSVGSKLLDWYSNPDEVEYLFSLGPDDADRKAREWEWWTSIDLYSWIDRQTLLAWGKLKRKYSAK